MRMFLKGRLLLFVVVVFLFSVMPMLAQDMMTETVQVTTTHVETHPSQGDIRVIEGAVATIMTNEAGASMSLSTDELINGHVYTAWWVIVNNPAACENSPCTPGDILGLSDAVQSEVTQADSLVMDDEAPMKFASYLPVGDVDNGWIGNGFTNPLGAEIHIVINDHGPVIADQIGNMLNTYRGGCTDESLPPPFPDTAKADGAPGPNTCRLVQDAILIQES